MNKSILPYLYTMILFPNAKINLGLRIVRKREDGFHDLESIFYPIPWKDSLEIVEAGHYHFEQFGFKLELNGKPNIVEEAYTLLQQQYDLPPVKMSLLKNIPAGAGLGGGSADAAFALKALNDAFALGLGKAQLKELAGRLGSDCPFFLENRPMKASGTGDQLEPVELSLAGYHLVVVYPGVAVATPWAYGQIQPSGQSISEAELLHTGPGEWDQFLVNDFEETVVKTYPAIGQMKEQLREMGALFAMMSGSGSAVYGIFTEAPDQVQVATALDLPQEYVFSGIL